MTPGRAIIDDVVRARPRALLRPERVRDPAERAAVEAMTAAYGDRGEYFVERLAAMAAHGPRRREGGFEVDVPGELPNNVVLIDLEPKVAGGRGWPPCVDGAPRAARPGRGRSRAPFVGAARAPYRARARSAGAAHEALERQRVQILRGARNGARGPARGASVPTVRRRPAPRGERVRPLLGRAGDRPARPGKACP